MASTDRDIDAEAPTAAGSDVGAAPTLASGDGHGVVVANGTAIGRFVVSGILGQGGMGVVVRARDPELGRDVAIKLLRPDQRGHGGLRLGREAQAMAKLSHPNVVTVYDVGERDGSAYIAMELVDGRTLRAWWAAQPRTWREVLDIYVAAGRGLAAAHAAGLVHRDFKPDNVLVGADGRPRVTDFGLVAAESRAVESGDAHGVALDSNLTVEGALMGTPAYMAPEQWRGETVDARTDQFAFCVALWEALHGERPFGGDTTLLLRESILDGAIRPPRHRVPRWLTAALERGVARDPAARWPKLSDLLDHLARPRRGKLVAAIVAVVVLGGGGLAFALWPRAGAPSCRAHEARMAKAWGEPRRDAVRAMLDDRAPIVVEPLDDYAQSWVDARITTCEDERRVGQAASVRATTAHCFDDALAQLDGVAAAVVAGGMTGPQIRSAVDALPPLAACADVSVLAALAQRPTDPAHAKQLAAVESTLARAETELALDHFAVARDLAGGIRSEAEAVDYAPTLATVLRVIGMARSMLGDNTGAEEVLRASLRAADAGRDDEGRLDSYLALIGVLVDLGRWDEATAMVADARAALARIRSPKNYVTRLLSYEAMVFAGKGDDARSVELVQQALDLEGESYGTDQRLYAELEYTLAGAKLQSDDADGAAPLLEHARKTMLLYVGDDAPMIGMIDNALSFVRYRDHDLPGAIALVEHALAIREKTEGVDSPSLGNMVFTLGGYYRVAGRADEAVTTLRRALGLLERLHGPDHPRVALALAELIQALMKAKKYDEAKVEAERLADLADRTELPPHTEAMAHYFLAEALWPEEKQRSLALARRAADELHALGDEENARTVETWIGAP